MNDQEGFLLGIEQFNQQHFYACHDTLEAVWLQCSPVDKNFYQGILQIAVAHYHLSNHNWQGCVTLLGEGIRRLKSFRPVYRNVNTESLVQESFTFLSLLQQVAPHDLSHWLALDLDCQRPPQIELLQPDG